MREFSIATELAADQKQVWKHCTSVRGVNDELGPWFRMTFPAGTNDLMDATVELGEPFCRSWLLLFKVVPVDWDRVTFVELQPGRRFVERSSMASQRLWHHERSVEATDEGCRVTDNLRWQGRFPGAERLFARVVPLLFRWRHRRLRRRFGAPASSR